MPEPRKRGRKPKTPKTNTMEDYPHTNNNSATQNDVVVSVPTTEPRKRGRKSKTPKTNTMDSSHTSNNSATQNDIVVPVPTTDIQDPSPAHRTRGRARKIGKLADDNNNDISHVASPERSRHGDATDITILPPRWDSVAAKAVPAMDAVVKVFCVHTEPNFSLAWQRKRQYSSSSSGFIVGGRRVLTNAHSVEHHTQVKLKKRGSEIKYLATVLSIGTECDIGNVELLLSFFIFLCMLTNVMDASCE